MIVSCQTLSIKSSVDCCSIGHGTGDRHKQPIDNFFPFLRARHPWQPHPWARSSILFNRASIRSSAACPPILTREKTHAFTLVSRDLEALIVFGKIGGAITMKTVANLVLSVGTTQHDLCHLHVRNVASFFCGSLDFVPILGGSNTSLFVNFFSTVLITWSICFKETL